MKKIQYTTQELELVAKETKNKRAKFHYKIVLKATNEVLAERRTNDVYVAACVYNTTYGNVSTIYYMDKQEKVDQFITRSLQDNTEPIIAYAAK